MPRRARNAPGGLIFHVLNRGVGRRTIFHKEEDYAAFERIMAEAHQRVPLRILGYCLMPNHRHFVVWPRTQEERSDFMQWLTHIHTQPWHAHYHTSDWCDFVNEPQSSEELAALRWSVTRGCPFGDDAWQQTTATQLGLQSTLRPRGRPPKEASETGY